MTGGQRVTCCDSAVENTAFVWFPTGLYVFVFLFYLRQGDTIDRKSNTSGLKCNIAGFFTRLSTGGAHQRPTMYYTTSTHTCSET